MEQLRRLAADTADHPPGRRPAKASDRFRKALLELRQELVNAGDDSRIEELVKKIDEIRDKDKPELDDGVEVTEAARERSGELLRMLTAGQVAVYAGGMAGDIPDPAGRLLDALAKARGLKGQEWQALRDEVSEEVGRLVGGLDPDDAQAVSDKVTQFLIMVRGLKEEEFKKQRPELEKAARAIVASAGPLDVLRHVMEHSLAELLSNPRLTAALDARLRAPQPQSNARR